MTTTTTTAEQCGCGSTFCDTCFAERLAMLRPPVQLGGGR